MSDQTQPTLGERIKARRDAVLRAAITAYIDSQVAAEVEAAKSYTDDRVTNAVTVTVDYVDTQLTQLVVDNGLTPPAAPPVEGQP